MRLLSPIHHQRTPDIIYLDSVFDTVSHKVSVEKLMKYGLDEQTVKWTENRLNSWFQRTAINCVKSSKRPVTSNVP